MKISILYTAVFAVLAAAAPVQRDTSSSVGAVPRSPQLPTIYEEDFVQDKRQLPTIYEEDFVQDK